MKCHICSKILSDKSNALGLHLYYSHKDVTQEQYYTTHIGDIGQCKCCGKHTEFIGVMHGYKDYCSLSCAVKHQQWDSEKGAQRKIDLAESNANLPGGNFYVGGRTKGSKNINPYPMTDAVLQRIDNLTELLRSRNHWTNINLEWWENASEEERNSRINNWLSSPKKTGIVLGPYDFIDEKDKRDFDKVMKRLDDIFDVS